jgi:hypothetical protein
MRKILEEWEAFQNRIVDAATRDKALERTNVLGVQLQEKPGTPQQNPPISAVSCFKSTKKRFANRSEEYLIFQNDFLDHMLTSPLQTLRMEDIDYVGNTYLLPSGEFAEDLRVYRSLGHVGNKTFGTVMKEKGVRASLRNSRILILVSIVSGILFFISLFSEWGSFDLRFLLSIVGTLSGFVGFLSWATSVEAKKSLYKDFLRAKKYTHLFAEESRYAALFNNTRANYHPRFNSGEFIKAHCEFLDFSNSTAGKEIITKAADLAENMKGKVFFLINGLDKQFPSTFLPKQISSGEEVYIFSLYIAEVGIRLKDETLFLKAWPAKQWYDPTFGTAHAEQQHKKKGLLLFNTP